MFTVYSYSVLSEKSAESLSRAFKLHVKESLKMFLIEQNDKHLHTATEMKI